MDAVSIEPVVGDCLLSSASTRSCSSFIVFWRSWYGASISLNRSADGGEPARVLPSSMSISANIITLVCINALCIYMLARAKRVYIFKHLRKLYLVNIGAETCYEFPAILYIRILPFIDIALLCVILFTSYAYLHTYFHVLLVRVSYWRNGYSPVSCHISFCRMCWLLFWRRLAG